VDVFETRDPALDPNKESRTAQFVDPDGCHQPAAILDDNGTDTTTLVVVLFVVATLALAYVFLFPERGVLAALFSMPQQIILLIFQVLREMNRPPSIVPQTH
jgi:hypothetical protein